MLQHERPSGKDWAENIGYDVESCQAEVKANSLIDEVFHEFEQGLESAYPLSVELMPARLEEQVQTDQHSEQSVTSDLFVPYAPYPGEPFANGDTTSDDAAKSNSWLQTIDSSSDRLLLGLACASILMTAGLWVASKFVFRPAIVPVAVASPAVQINPADAQFAQYMQRALEIIGQQPTATAPQPSTAIASSLPPIEVNSPVSGQVAKGVERIYIPVYKPQPAQTVAPTNFSLPPQVAAVAPTAPSPAPVKPLAAPTARYTLRGVMEMGDRSVALLDMNGTSQRIAVGQPLGATGWQLVQIADQKAVVQRKGEVRSITVGQQF
jgi:hypothetical protein